MSLSLLLGGVCMVGGLVCLAFATPLAGKMRRDEARWGDQGTTSRMLLQTPGRMRAYGGVMVLIGVCFFIGAIV
jgi:hypothetical protein